jgi:hypothetical protein
VVPIARWMAGCAYRSGPSRTWLKSKKPASEAVRRECEAAASPRPSPFAAIGAAKIVLAAPVIIANDLLDGLFVPLSLTVGWIGTLLFLFGGTEVARRTKLATTYAGP